MKELWSYLLHGSHHGEGKWSEHAARVAWNSSSAKIAKASLLQIAGDLVRILLDSANYTIQVAPHGVTGCIDILFLDG